MHSSPAPTNAHTHTHTHTHKACFASARHHKKDPRPVAVRCCKDPRPVAVRFNRFRWIPIDRCCPYPSACSFAHARWLAPDEELTSGDYFGTSAILGSGERMRHST
eukprot:4036820-Prymnesium_polylepis.1